MASGCKNEEQLERFCIFSISAISVSGCIGWSPGQEGHQGALTCLACNKDGSLVLTGSVDGYAKLINTATGKVGVRAA